MLATLRSPKVYAFHSEVFNPTKSSPVSEDFSAHKKKVVNLKLRSPKVYVFRSEVFNLLNNGCPTDNLRVLTFFLAEIFVS